ncbi:hypothetical protein NKG94_45920 [Micromonospora sp. M12]
MVVSAQAGRLSASAPRRRVSPANSERPRLTSPPAMAVFRPAAWYCSRLRRLMVTMTRATRAATTSRMQPM